MGTSTTSVETRREKWGFRRQAGWARSVGARSWERPRAALPAEGQPHPVIGSYLLTHSLPKGTVFSPPGQNSL